ncbi:MAG: Ig-like domain repeat protein [Acidobacteria bacterium]|nr:Ig-like domain repeat protein [Acidobacteriota bacterium]MCL5286631.1 Ig-like domain repeat protein [Acidobacteriota bacterium]
MSKLGMLSGLTKGSDDGKSIVETLVWFWRRGWVRKLSFVGALALVIWVSWIPKPAKVGSAQATARYAQLPVSFEVNQGQAGGETKFLARGGGYSLLLGERGEPVLVLNGKARQPGKQRQRTTREAGAKKEPQHNAEMTVLRFQFPGGNPAPKMEGEERLPGYSNYLLGNDPQKWITGVPHFARVRYREVYPGVDLLYYGKGQQLEYDFIVKPGAEPRAIRMTVQGAKKLEVNKRGNLVVQTGQGRVVMHKPVAIQGAGGGARSVECSYTLDKNGEAGFALGEYDANKPLRIDPVLSYAAQIDGDVRAIAIDSAGNSYLAGFTSSVNFPTTPGALQSSKAGASFEDAFIAKLDASGTTLLFATYLGGSSVDLGHSIAIDTNGNIFVAGETDSLDFPVMNAFQTTLAGNDRNAFLAKLDAAGAQLLYSTYLGGQGSDRALGLAIDFSGHVLLAGATTSSDFPTTTGAFQTVYGGSQDAFAAKVDSSQSGAASLLYSTFLGGSKSEAAYSIAADSSGNAFVTGSTESANFPTASPIQASCASCGNDSDAFVSKLNASGAALVYSTYLGGNSWETGHGIAVDSAGNAYVAGETASSNFPTTVGAFQTTNAGGTDVFVTKVNAGGATLVYSSYVGGHHSDGARGIALDSAGNAYLTGYTYSTNFPTVAAVQGAAGGGECGSYFYYYYACSDAMAPQLNASGSALVYSTYLGSANSDDFGTSIALDAAGNAYVTGMTGSGFPFTPDALRTSGSGFAAKISPQAAPGIAFDKASVTFAPQTVGTTSGAQSVLLRNMGSATLNVSDISVSGDFAQSNNCGTSVTGGGNCVIDVTFAPTSIGALAGTLSITHDAAGSPHSVPLSGTGTSSAVLTFSTNSVVFPARDIRTTSAAQLVTLKNTGTGDLGILQISVSGDFAQSNNCGGTLTMNSACDVNVTFTPTARGNRSGTLSITHDAAGSPGKVALSGTGIGLTTTTMMVSSLNPSTVGQFVTFTATVSPASATGIVEFWDVVPDTLLGTASLNANGVASVSTSALAAGAQSIVAVYRGDADYEGSESAVLPQTVNKLSTATTLGSSLNPSDAGQGVTFTATVSPSTATGTVTFLDGSTALGTVTLSGGIAIFSTSTLTAGSHSLTADYVGDATHNASTSTALVQDVVKISTTTTLSSSPNPSNAGQAVTFTATVSPSTAAGTVTFMDGGTTLGTGTLNNGTATLPISSLTGGTHTITAAYSGDANSGSSTSIALAQTVNSISMAASSNSASVSPGGTANFTLTVNQAGALSSPITFTCTGLPVGGSCAFNPPSVPAGSGATAVAVAINVGGSFAGISRYVPPAEYPASPFFVVAALAMMAVCAVPMWRMSRAQLSRVGMTLALVLFLVAFTGCGGIANQPPPPPPQVQVTVNAVSGSTTTSMVFTITVVK